MSSMAKTFSMPALGDHMPQGGQRRINAGNTEKIDLSGARSVHSVHRLRLINWMPPTVRIEFVAWLSEFVGTFLFLFIAFSSTQVANFASVTGSAVTAPNTSNLLFVSLAFGFSLAVNAWVFFRISGGLFNPAVTLGMWLIGAITWMRAIIVFVAQILGAIASAAVVSGLFPGPMNVRTTLSNSCSITRGLFIEMFLTALLVFTIFMLAAEKHKSTFIAPIGIGLALFIAEMPGVFYTGGSLNPARSFGPAVVLGSFNGYHWIYWVGPLLGTLVAVAFYKLVKGLEYETVNPGQDADAHFDPENAEPAGRSVKFEPTSSRPNHHAASASPTLSADDSNGKQRSVDHMA